MIKNKRTVTACLEISTEESFDSNSNMCQINAVFSIYSATNEIIYNCWFFLYLILKVRSSIKTSFFTRKIFHLFVQTISLIVTLFGYFIVGLGKSLFGTCSLKASNNFNSSMGGIVLLILYLIYAFNTILYLKKKLPNSKEF